MEATFDAAAIVARGWLGLDAMIQFRPFHFRAEIHAGFEVEALGLTFCGVSLEGSIEGPGPMSIAGRITIETFLKDIHWNETFTFGGGSGDRAGRAVDLLAEVVGKAREPGALTASAPHDPDVVLAPRGPAGVVLSPLGTLRWNQRRTPLGIRCDRLEGEPLSPRGQGVTVDVSAPAVNAGAQRSPFATGTFADLTETEALHVNPFDEHDSGVRIGFATDDGPDKDQPPSVRVLVLPLQSPLALALREGVFDLGSHGSHRQLANAGLAAAAVWDGSARVTVQDDDWRTADGASHPTVAAAWQHAKHVTGALPVHATDPVVDTVGV